MRHAALAIRCGWLLLAALAVSGCGVGSVNPLVSDADAKFDARLLGSWRDSGGQESAVIAAQGPQSYSLVYTEEKGKVGRFRAVLGRMGGFRVLDVEPEDPAPQASDVYRSLMLPLHGVVFIDSIGPTLRFRTLDADSLKGYLSRHPLAVAHLLRDGEVVLTAPAPELQRFVASYARRRGSLGEQHLWVRRTP